MYVLAILVVRGLLVLTIIAATSVAGPCPPADAC